MQRDAPIEEKDFESVAIQGEARGPIRIGLVYLALVLVVAMLALLLAGGVVQF